MPLNFEELPFIAAHKELHRLHEDESGKYSLMERDEKKVIAHIVNNEVLKGHGRQEFEDLAVELSRCNMENPHFLKFMELVDEGHHENQKIFLFEPCELNSLERWIEH